jgi:hypothetical protein
MRRRGAMTGSTMGDAKLVPWRGAPFLAPMTHLARALAGHLRNVCGDNPREPQTPRFSSLSQT